MARIKSMTVVVLVAVNIMVVAAMNICAWSSHISPAEHARVSYLGMVFPAFLAGAVAFLLFWLVLRSRYALISVAGVLLCAQSARTFMPLNLPSNPPEGCIKFVSYNVMGFGDNDVRQPYEENEIVQYLLCCGADIVALQECFAIPKDRLEELFGEEYSYISEMKSNEAGRDQLTVFSRFPIVESGRIDYPSESNCSYFFRIDVDGDTVLVVNNHFESYHLVAEDKDDYKTIIREPKDSGNKQRFGTLASKLKNANIIRSAQVDSVYNFIERSQDKYVICCGDFNDASISYTHWKLTRLLDDAFTRSGNGAGISYNRSGMYFRIDNILISQNITAYGAKVDNFSKASDHYPIISYLKFGKK